MAVSNWQLFWLGFCVLILLVVLSRKPVGNNRNIIGQIWKWKISGICVWCLLVFLSYVPYVWINGRIVSKLNAEPEKSNLVNRWSLLPACFTFLLLPLYFYTLSLTTVPVHMNVLDRNGYMKRVLFYIGAYIGFYVNCLVFVRFQTATFVAFVLTYVLSEYLDFVIPQFGCKSQKSRFQNLCYVYRLPTSRNMTMIIGMNIIINIIVNPAVRSGTELIEVGLFSSVLFILFTVCFCITAVICGEETSLTSLQRSYSRLNKGLTDRSAVVKNWAYSNLVRVCRHRNDLSHDENSFDELIKILNELLSKFYSAQEDLKRIDREDIVNKRKDDKQQASERNTMHTIRHIIPDAEEKQRDIENENENFECMTKEWEAMKDAIYVRKAIEAIVYLLTRSTSLPGALLGGQIEAFMEAIVNIGKILRDNCITEEAWMTSKFSIKWYSSSYRGLVSELGEVTEWACDMLVRRFGKDLNYNQFRGKSNAREIKEMSDKYNRKTMVGNTK